MGGGRSVTRPGRFTPGKVTCCPLYRRLGGSQGRSRRVRKISSHPHRDLNPGPSSPYRVAIQTELSRPTLQSRLLNYIGKYISASSVAVLNLCVLIDAGRVLQQGSKCATIFVFGTWLNEWNIRIWYLKSGTGIEYKHTYAPEHRDFTIISKSRITHTNNSGSWERNLT